MEEIKVVKKETTERRKKIFISFMDLFVLFVIELLLFLVCELIFINTSKYDTRLNNMVNKQIELVDICKQTKLTYEIVEDGETMLSSPISVVDMYVYSLLYTSLKTYNAEQANHGMFEKATLLSADTDPCFYYYNTFVVENNSMYKANENKLLSIEQYKEKYNSLVENTTSNIFTSDFYPILNEDIANALFVSFSQNEQKNNPIYKSISDAYYDLLTEAIENFLSLYEPYVATQAECDYLVNQFYEMHVIILLICYFFTATIIYLIVPLVTKGRTLFMLVFKTEYVSTQYEPITFQDIIIRYFVILISFIFLNVFISFAILGSEQGLMVLFTPILKVLSFALLSVFDILFVTCSIIFTFYRREKKQFFSEFFSNILMIEKTK